MKDIWLERFKKEVLPILKSKFNPTSVIVFGSRARGEGGEHSDIDVVVVSESFRGIPFLKRMPALLRLIKGFGKHIDFLCYTEEEFERIKVTSSIVRDAVREGIETLSG